MNIRPAHAYCLADAVDRCQSWFGLIYAVALARVAPPGAQRTVDYTLEIRLDPSEGRKHANSLITMMLILAIYFTFRPR